MNLDPDSIWLVSMILVHLKKDLAVACLGAGLGATGMRWMLSRQGGVTTISYSVGF